jgi:hypothetical protein
LKHFLAILLMMAASAAAATEHRVAAGDGALQSLVNSGTLQGGDRIVLEDGLHGLLDITGHVFEQPVTVAPAPGAEPLFTRVVITRSAGWELSGLTVRPMGTVRGALVSVGQSRDIVIEGFDIASADNTDGWGKGIWKTLARTGISASGERITLRDNKILNVSHGISSRARAALVENNTISHFIADGIRGLGDDSIYRGNHIDTCIKVDDHHDDGFQSWSVGPDRKPGRGVVRNVRLESNRIENGDHPLKCTLQGIGLFDGIYEDWVIVNNVVVVDSWHGITVMGARNVEVTRNIVVDSRPGRPGPPWISITNHKDGRPPENGIVQGNVTQRDLSRSGGQWHVPRPGVLAFLNLKVDDPERALAASEP